MNTNGNNDDRDTLDSDSLAALVDTWYDRGLSALKRAEKEVKTFKRMVWSLIGIAVLSAGDPDILDAVINLIGRLATN